jgi:hypothetical protein
MANYYVNANAQSTGEHEVHVNTCVYFSQIVDARYLGAFLTCQAALQEARNRFPDWTVDGCKSCIPECHTR